MSVFKKISERIRIMGEENDRMQRYSAMTVEELSELPDEELVIAASTRIDKTIREKNELMRAVIELPRAQRMFFLAKNYEAQLERGGLWQYFADSSHRMAPYLQEALREIGAFDHLRLYADFVFRNNIDIQDPAMFSTFELRKYEQMENDPFGAFDAEYRRLEPISEHLKAYVRANSDKF